jgi:MFS family permease
MLALLYLQWHPQDYKTLFFIAFIPGFIAVLCSLLLKDKKTIVQSTNAKPSFFSFLGYWKQSPVLYRKLVAGLLVFTLFNSSDIFLLLRAKQAGLDDTNIITIYIFYNLVYATFAFPIGILADKIGLKKIFITGLFIFTLVYGGMAYAKLPLHFYGLFFLYGIYAAATEGISKAWISNISAKEDTATAIGTYSAFQSICTMLASSLAGIIWFQFGSITLFTMSAIVAFLVVVYLTFYTTKKTK